MRQIARWLCAGVVAFSAMVETAIAAPYPDHTVEIIVSYSAGGSTDLVARAIAQRLQDRLGHPFVVINRPGASGTIGALSAARAAPDGYTLYVGFTTEMVVAPQLAKVPKYSVDDFEPIAVTGVVPVVLIASKQVRATTLAELIAEIRAAPGRYTYGGGIGSPSHVMGAWLNRLKHLNVTHIPYRGGAQAVADVIGSHIDMFYAGTAPAKAAIDSNSVKAIAIGGEARSAALPNVPTFKEAGVPEFDLESWNVMLAPKGTPADIVDLLRRETTLALSDPAIRKTLATQGVEPAKTQDVRGFLRKEHDKFGAVVRDLGISAQD